MEMDECIHHLDGRMSSSDALFLVNFGAPPISGRNEIDKTNRKSLYYHDLRKKRP